MACCNIISISFWACTEITHNFVQLYGLGMMHGTEFDFARSHAIPVVSTQPELVSA